MCTIKTIKIIDILDSLCTHFLIKYLCSVVKSWWNFKRINTYFSKHIGKLKKARRLGNYCVCTVITPLLALALIFGGDEGSRTPVQKCCHIDFSEHSLWLRSQVATAHRQATQPQFMLSRLIHMNNWIKPAYGLTSIHTW